MFRFARRLVPVALALVALVPITLLAPASQPVQAALTWYVDPNGSDTLTCGTAPGVATACQSLNYTIANRAADGDTISLAGGTYPNTHTALAKAVTILGAGARTTILDGGGAGGSVLSLTGARTVSLSDLTIQHGSGTNVLIGTFYGGGVYQTAGTLSLTRVTVQDNSVAGGEARGGGVYVANDVGPVTLLIDASSILNNTASTSVGHSTGSGVFATQATVSVTNSTLAGNQALAGPTASTDGGALNADSSTVSLSYVTVAGNSAVLAVGGLAVSNASLTLTSVILAGNGRNCAGNTTPTLQGVNLSSDGFCGFGAGRDNATLDLGPLGNNGGPTDTLLPGSGSAAIDANSAGCPPPVFDQRGFARPVGAGCDSGAVEAAAPTPTPTSTSTSTATSTATRTATNTVTATPTATGTATNTATPTSTPTPTGTAPATTTASATRTPTSTATATPPLPAPVAGNLRLLDPPSRIVDTRPNDPPAGIATTGFQPGGAPIVAGQLADGAVVRYAVAGRTFTAGAASVTVPADATAILINLTTIQAQASGGFVTAFPGDASAPNASTLNPSTAIAANFTTVALGAAGANAGTLGLKSVGAARDVAIDLVGYYAPSVPASQSPGNLKLVAPVRVLDTRLGANGPIGYDAAGHPLTAATTSPIGAGQTRTFTLAGQSFGGGASAVVFPTDVAGVLAHVTAVQPGGVGTGGFLTLLPGAGVPAGGTGTPRTSTVNPITPIAFNGAAIAVPTIGPGAGQFSLYSSSGPLDVAVDVLGYWAASISPAQSAGQLTLVTPGRVLDTRPAPFGPIGFGPNGLPLTAAPLGPGVTRSVWLAGQTFPGGLYVPADAKGVLANVTLVQGSAGGGYVSVYPGDQPLPQTSTVNPSTAIAASFAASGLATIPAANPGTLNVTSIGDTRDVLIDVVGYFR